MTDLSFDLHTFCPTFRKQTQIKKRDRTVKTIVCSLAMVLTLTALGQGTLQPLPAPIFGPDSLVFDSQTGLTWLGVRYTVNLSYNDVVTNSKFAGYRHATPAELSTLFDDAGLTQTSSALLDGVDPSSAISTFLNLFGPTFYINDRPGILGVSDGYWTGEVGPVLINGQPKYAVNTGYQTSAINPDLAVISVGQWMVATPAPEPAMWALLVLAVANALTARKGRSVLGAACFWRRPG
jgi:hypothetical protein